MKTLFEKNLQKPSSIEITMKIQIVFYANITYFKQTHLGDTYLLIKPDIGLFYPAADFLTKKVSELAENHSNNDIPLIIDCQRFKGVDYTAVKVWTDYSNFDLMLI